VPIGDAGELYLGGIQVGRGYYNEPELTRERFIADPFKNGSSSQLYKTGDLVRYLPDGNLEFLGRLDHQVKIHGRRIELDEINSVIRCYSAVQESVVVARENATGDMKLVAYVKPAIFLPALARELRSILKDQLPTYMLPAAIVVLDKFPLTPNGKIDRAALPAPGPRAFESEALKLNVPPQNPTEQTLVGIWCEFLKIPHVGIHDNFFELGGDSLMMVAMTVRINEVLSINLNVEDLFQNPTVEKLAKIILTGGSTVQQRSSVIQLKQGQTHPPVYFIDAGADQVRLAGLLGGDHLVFGIRVPWPAAWWHALANDQTSSFPRLDQLVALYVEALSSSACSSPCVLAGYSFAGLLAFEVAHQFQSRGGVVDMVLLLDTWARRPTAYEVAWYHWRREWMRGPRGALPYEIARSIGPRLWRSWLITQWLLGKGANKLLRKLRKASIIVGGRNLSSLDMQIRLYANMLKSYHPQPLNSRGILFRSESLDDSDERYYRGAVNCSQGWNNLFSGGLEIVSVPGNHVSMMREHNKRLAQKITQVLKRH
jgi:thioesterase domain-containing protein/acyl carrier protein